MPITAADQLHGNGTRRDEREVVDSGTARIPSPRSGLYGSGNAGEPTDNRVDAGTHTSVCGKAQWTDENYALGLSEGWTIVTERLRFELPKQSSLEVLESSLGLRHR